jgi:autotransporter passenger strand-loop-strand repeat protein
MIMVPHAGSGFDALYHLCRASGGSTARIESAVRCATAVNSGGIAVSSAQITELAQWVREVWQSSGGSRALFEDGLKRRFGLVNGGKRFVAALSLACGLQMILAAAGHAAFTPIVSSGVTVTGETVGPGSSQTVLSGGTANSTRISGAEGVFGTQIVSGGVANHSFLGSFGAQRIVAGGVANSTILSGASIQQIILSGGVANHTILWGGGTGDARAVQGVMTGGVAHSTIVNFGAAQVIRGGTAYDTIVNSGGVQQILNGGASFLPP